MKMRALAVFAALTLVLNCEGAAQNKLTKVAKEQTSFCEDGWANKCQFRPTPMPEDVQQAIMQTPEGREAQEWTKNEGKSLDVSKLFTGMRIRLTNSPDSFYLVMGSFPMSGGDNTWFWIVRSSERISSVLLFTGANCVDLRPSSTNGLRNIRTQWASGTLEVTSIYKYNGQKYVLSRTRSVER